MIRSIALILCTLSFTCCGGQTLKHPSSTLKETGRPSSIHIEAMEALDASVGIDDDNYQQTLKRMMWVPGYTTQARKAALVRLWSTDQEGTTRLLRQQIPRLDNWTWLTELCEWIADEHVVALDEALISSWAIPTPMVQSEKDRPEYAALVKMYGEESIEELVFTSLVSNNKTWKQGYRIRCWELLHRLSKRETLITLLNSKEFNPEDSFLLDLRKAMNDLGIVPQRKEEILWIRELATTDYEAFWSEAVEALGELSNARRSALEMRDIPMVVSIRRHTPEYLNIPIQQVVNEIQQKLKGRKHYFEYEGGGNTSTNDELLSTHKHRLTWGDAMAITTALSAMEVPEVRKHLFDYATRDQGDETTEYGGVIALDTKGRFEILEFEPKIRHHDRRFNASQDMFDAAYTALFHFHFHAQKFRNRDHAGPGMGDKNYADNTRANCLVFTFVNEETLNVDYYRHGHVVVDLGVIRR